MAIVKMEQMTLIASQAHQKEALRLIQACQQVELYRSEPMKEGEGALRAGAEMPLWKENLQQIARAQGVLATRRKKDTLQKLRTGRRILTLSQLEQEVQDGSWEELCETVQKRDGALQINRKRRHEFSRLAEEWSSWEGLQIHPSFFTQLSRTKAIVGTVPAASAEPLTEQLSALPDDSCYFERIFSGEKKTGFFVMMSKDGLEQTEEILRGQDFSEIQYSFKKLPTEMIQEWKDLELDLVGQEETLLKELEELAKSAETLDMAEEYYQNLVLREEAKQYLPLSKENFLLSGWVAAEDRPLLTEYLNAQFKAPYYLAFDGISAGGSSEPPILLKNNKVLSAFENLTEMYGMPGYSDLDPTPIVAPFYIMFFGMMVADTGYGLLMLLLTFIARTYFKPDKGLRRNIDFFYYLSFSVMLWGLVFGSFFGITLPTQLISPTEDIITVLVLAVALGWIQLMTGLALNAYLSLKSKDVLSAVGNGFSWMGILAGLLLIVFGKIVWDLPLLFYAGAALCVAGALLVLAVPVLLSKHSRVKGVLKGLYALYGVSGYIGDLVSYTRLMALGLAGGSIALAFNTIISSLPFPIRITVGVLLAAGMHLLNIFLSLLGAYVHGLRLQYVEFFGKFYTGNGRAFRPFKTLEKHIYLAQNKTEYNSMEESV